MAAADSASESIGTGEEEKAKAPAEKTQPLENVPTVKAYKNVEFLTSPIARHIRIMCEVQEPQKRLTENSIDNYVLFLGSHLVMHPEERTGHIAELEKQIKLGGPRDEIEALSAKIRFQKQMQQMDRYYVSAMELGEKIAKWSRDRQKQGLSTYHVCSGGGPGVMEAANRGASSVGELTLGLGSTRPEWGSMNKYVSEACAFEFHYFFMRKFWMAYKCMGLVVYPGGYGSLDELFEILALVSSKKITHRLPIILMGRDHWKKAINFDYLIECGMLSRENLDIVVYMDTPEEAFQYLVEQLKQADESGDNVVVDAAKRRRLSKQVGHGPPKGS